MSNASVLTFHEYAMREPLPLATIHEALLDFLRGRKDPVLFSAIAVNAYVSEPRMTQDIDLLSTDAKNLAEELQAFLSDKFHIVARVCEIGDRGLRIYQVRKEGNRHLIDIRLVAELPDTETIEDIRVLSPVELIVSKVIFLSFAARQAEIGNGLARFGDVAFAVSRIERKSCGKFANEKCQRSGFGNLGGDFESGFSV